MGGGWGRFLHFLLDLHSFSFSAFNFPPSFPVGGEMRARHVELLLLLLQLFCHKVLRGEEGGRTEVYFFVVSWDWGGREGCLSGAVNKCRGAERNNGRPTDRPAHPFPPPPPTSKKKLKGSFFRLPFAATYMRKEETRPLPPLDHHSLCCVCVCVGG